MVNLAPDAEISANVRDELERSMRLPHLWALGVGAVISGNFQGWNYGLHVGGFGGLLTAMLPAATLYTCLCLSLAELAAMSPEAAGLHTFAAAAFGHHIAFIVGLSASIEYIVTPAAIAVAIGGYVRGLTGSSEDLDPAVWTTAFSLFTVMHIYGLSLTILFSLGSTLMAMAVLMVYWCGCFVKLDVERYALSVGDRSLWPEGWRGIASALPFAMWFFLAIEELPLASKEAVNPSRDIPLALLLSLVTLLTAGLLTIIGAAGSPPGADRIAFATDPVVDAFDHIFGTGAVAEVLSVSALAGLLASFHSIIYASARQLYALAQEGYMPAWLAWRARERHTPAAATLAGSTLGLGIVLGLHATGSMNVLLPKLLNISVCSALITYIITLGAYLRLRVGEAADSHRPYRSPLGLTGAALGLALALSTLGCMFTDAGFLHELVVTMFFLGFCLICYSLRGWLSVGARTEDALIFRTECQSSS